MDSRGEVPQNRGVLIVGDPAGLTEQAEEVLRRFGFAEVDGVPDMGSALARIRTGRYRLVLVPLESLGAADLAALELELQRDRAAHAIGTAPREDPELILAAMRAGIHEFLTRPLDPGELAGALSRLLRRDAAPAVEGRVVAVFTTKGGLGSTTLAINLAHALVQHEPSGRVALVDLVMGGGDVSVFLDMKPAYDLGDLAAKVDRIDADLLYSLLTAREGGVWVLPATEKPEMADAVGGTAVSSIVAQLRTHFAFTILDCEHSLTERTIAALDAADVILLVTQLNIAALRGTQRTLELCQRLGYGEGKVRVVVNRHHDGDLVSAADAARVLEREIYHRLPNDYRTATAAMAQGVAVGRYDAGGQLAQGYLGLAARLAGGRSAEQPSNHRPRPSRLGRLFGIGRT